MSTTKSVLIAFAALTAATASAAAATTPDDRGTAVLNVGAPSVVIPSSAFAAKFIDAAVTNDGGNEMKLAGEPFVKEGPIWSNAPRFAKNK